MMKFKVDDKIYKVTDRQAKEYSGCHMTWMNRKVMDKIGYHPFAWFDGNSKDYDYYAARGNLFD